MTNYNRKLATGAKVRTISPSGIRWVCPVCGQHVEMFVDTIGPPECWSPTHRHHGYRMTTASTPDPKSGRYFDEVGRETPGQSTRNVTLNRGSGRSVHPAPKSAPRAQLALDIGNGERLVRAINCAECGSPFAAKRSTARYCSDACKMRAHRRSR